MIYREPAPGAPADDPRLVVPGEGLRGIRVGRASAEDVLRVFGHDVKRNVLDRGEIYGLDYDYASDEVYDPDRAAQAARPATFRFEFLILQSIRIGPHQTGLTIEGGLRYESPRKDVLRVLGAPHAIDRLSTFETLRYPDRGIEVDIHLEDDDLMGCTIFRARR